MSICREVQTTPANLKEDIGKAIKAGYERIVVFATNYTAMTRIRDVLLDEENTPEGMEDGSPSEAQFQLG